MNKRQRKKIGIIDDDLKYKHYLDCWYKADEIDFKGLYRKRFEQALTQAGVELDKHTLGSLHYYDFEYLLTICDKLDPRLALLSLHDEIEGRAIKYEEFYPVIEKMVTWLSQNQKYIPVICTFLEFMRHKFARVNITYLPKTDYQVSKEISEFKKAILEHEWDVAKEVGINYTGWWN